MLKNRLKLHSYFFWLTFFVSLTYVCCTPPKRLVSVKINQAGDSIILQLPRGCNRSTVLGDHEYEQRFLYSDSSIIYITTFNNTPNHENIRESDQYRR